MTKTTLAKTRNRTRTAAHNASDSRISTGAVATFGTLSTLVGLWAVACFVGAMISTGGPIALAGAWISAVAGG